MVCALLCSTLARADLERIGAEAAQRYGAKTVAAVDAWRQMMEAAATRPEQDRLALVNNFFNRRLRFEDDRQVWNAPDYWATPLEALSRGAGDCEDFAIAKFASLRMLGVPAERLRLIYVRANIGAADSGISQAHMVLGYYPTPDAEPLVLDNLINDVRPAGRRPDLFPVFSFSDAGLWVAGASQSSADPTTRLSRWRDVLDRMGREGIRLVGSP